MRRHRLPYDPENPIWWRINENGTPNEQKLQELVAAIVRTTNPVRRHAVAVVGLAQAHRHPESRPAAAAARFGGGWPPAGFDPGAPDGLFEPSQPNHGSGLTWYISVRHNQACSARAATRMEEVSHEYEIHSA